MYSLTEIKLRQVLMRQKVREVKQVLGQLRATLSCEESEVKYAKIAR